MSNKEIKKIYEDIYNNNICDLTINERLQLTRLILNDCIDTIIENVENTDENDRTLKKMVIDLVDITKSIKKLEY